MILKDTLLLMYNTNINNNNHHLPNYMDATCLTFLQQTISIDYRLIGVEIS